MRKLKFAVGEEVKVKADSKWRSGRFAGMEGTITAIQASGRWPYEVEFNGSVIALFHANELEKV